LTIFAIATIAQNCSCYPYSVVKEHFRRQSRRPAIKWPVSRDPMFRWSLLTIHLFYLY